MISVVFRMRLIPGTQYPADILWGLLLLAAALSLSRGLAWNRLLALPLLSLWLISSLLDLSHTYPSLALLPALGWSVVLPGLISLWLLRSKFSPQA